jgi:putative aldouronate transport system substrate-binding protein
MKQVLKAVVVLLLIGATAMSFVSCKKEGAGKGGDMYPVTISVFTQSPQQQPNADNKVYKYIEENLGVTFEWDILVGDIAQKRGTMIAGEDYPDVIEINETQFIDAGALIPLEDLITQYGPNIKKHFENNNAWDKMFSPDGHLYYMTNWGVYHGANQSPYYGGAALWIQKKVLKDAGYPEVATLDQYFDVITDYMDKNPKIDGQPTVGFSILTHDWRAFSMWNPPNFLAGYPNDGNGIVDPETHKYENFFVKDISKRWFKKFNELNQGGYIDRASFTDNYDQYIAKLATGRVLGMHDQAWQFQSSQDSLRDQGKIELQMAPLPIVFDDSIKPHYRDYPEPNLGRGAGISINAKDPIRIIRFVNELITEDVQRVIEWGIEGEDWQYDDSGSPYMTPAQRADWENATWQAQNRAILVRDVFPTWQGSWTDGYPTVLTDYYPERKALEKPEDVELWAAYDVTNYAELMDPNPPANEIWYPTWNMPNPPDGSDAQVALTRCDQTMRKYLPKLILADPADFDKIWDEYVDVMVNTNKIADYEAYMQKMLDDRIAARSGK